jgi:uroporphyrinogen decarboxylase
MSSFSGRERIMAAVRGEEVDRAPIALWRHFPGRDTTAEGLAEAVIAFQRRHALDLVKVTSASGYPAEAWGATLAPDDNREGTRQYAARPIRSAADWHALQPLDVDAPVLARELRALRRVRIGVGPDVHVLPTVFSPLTVAKQLAGRELMLEHLRHQPAALHAGLATVAESTARFAVACLRHGADGVFFATQFARRDVLDDGAHAEFGEAYDRVVLEALGGTGALLLLHLCGDQPMFDLADRYSAAIVNWHDQGTPPTLADGLAQRRAGAVLGGLDREALARDDDDALASAVRAALAATGSRRHILGAGCVVYVHTPDRALDAVRRAVGTTAPRGAR